MRNLPTPFHLRALWTAITALSITITVGIVVGVIFLGTQIVGFLQPILVPFAVAGVMAYLLDPLVAWLMRRGLSREKSVWAVFVVATLIVAGVAIIVISTLKNQGPRFQQVVPTLVEKARTNVSGFVLHWHDRLKRDYNIELLDYLGATKKSSEPSSLPSDTETGVSSVTTGEKAVDATQNFGLNELLSGAWIKDAVPRVAGGLWSFVRNSVGGFLGVFGFLLSFVIVPLYLYYFLMESAVIKERWSEYVPLRESSFRDEVVGTLTEINGYLVAFFRGQLVVSLINGLATGLGLTIVGLDFGWLIGLSMCVLGMIPYVGILLAWVPAVLIASVQGGVGTWIPDNPWWVFPLVVTGIFVVVQQIDGLFITPRIVGESVGLHPMTVILSLFGWGLVLGGLLGAILGVPLTACLKVLFQRYVWTKAAAAVGENLATTTDGSSSPAI